MAALSVSDIQQIIPEREGLLMVDQVLATDETQITTQQTIRKEAPYFKGHFPNEPVVPGVLLVEGLQQTAKLWLYQNFEIKNVALAALKKVKFRKMVTPDSQLTYQVQCIEQQAQQYVFKGVVMLADQKACQATFTMHLKD
ncbi:3-hydroxyacyl-ACP dehydratase FabZ family protein [Agrilactobacillus yilanensis]|uniref:3-hydroxyacyl-ACP dehydratase FabZ family protein n=1 Tax=Agrilactobacillus yilanensis TaxID=2485997 RepID=A0ABW4J6C0_9LACO|nr:3-hydroxyacyl-ACP dehydratase FabZ family protein [Agrilactobacillus yilanensis]